MGLSIKTGIDSCVIRTDTDLRDGDIRKVIDEKWEHRTFKNRAFLDNGIKLKKDLEEVPLFEALIIESRNTITFQLRR